MPDKFIIANVKNNTINNSNKGKLVEFLLSTFLKLDFNLILGCNSIKCNLIVLNKWLNGEEEKYDFSSKLEKIIKINIAMKKNFNVHINTENIKLINLGIIKKEFLEVKIVGKIKWWKMFPIKKK